MANSLLVDDGFWAVLEPLMVVAARSERAAAGVTVTPEVVVADAGYWHLEQMYEITGDGISVLIPPDSSRRKNKPRRPGWDGGAYDFMRSVLASERGGELYKQGGASGQALLLPGRIILASEPLRNPGWLKGQPRTSRAGSAAA